MDSNVVLEALKPAGNLTDNAIHKTFQDLINGDMTPDMATKRMDALIYEEHNSTQRAEGNPDIGLLERQYFVLDLLPKIAVQVPAAHPGQDRLVEVLRNIPRLPYREVTKNSGEKVNLWSEVIIKEFEEQNLAFWESKITGIFSFIHKWQCFGGHHFPERGEPEPSLENFSAFCARLFVAGMNSSTGRTIKRAPFTKLDHSKAFPDDYDPHACAAAQWLLYAGPEFFEMCEMRASGYSRSSWELWRVKFTAIEASQTLSDHCRQTAGKVLQRMKQVEEVGVTTNVVYHYNMGYLDGDMIVSSRPEDRSYVGKKSQWNEYGEDGEI